MAAPKPAAFMNDLNLVPDSGSSPVTLSENLQFDENYTLSHYNTGDTQQDISSLKQALKCVSRNFIVRNIQGYCLTTSHMLRALYTPDDLKALFVPEKLRGIPLINIKPFLNYRNRTAEQKSMTDVSAMSQFMYCLDNHTYACTMCDLQPEGTYGLFPGMAENYTICRCAEHLEAAGFQHTNDNAQRWYPSHGNELDIPLRLSIILPSFLEPVELPSITDRMSKDEVYRAAKVAIAIKLRESRGSILKPEEHTLHPFIKGLLQVFDKGYAKQMLYIVYSHFADELHVDKLGTVSSTAFNNYIDESTDFDTFVCLILAMNHAAFQNVHMFIMHLKNLPKFESYFERDLLSPLHFLERDDARDTVVVIGHLLTILIGITSLAAKLDAVNLHEQHREAGTLDNSNGIRPGTTLLSILREIPSNPDHDRRLILWFRQPGKLRFFCDDTTGTTKESFVETFVRNQRSTSRTHDYPIYLEPVAFEEEKESDENTMATGPPAPPPAPVPAPVGAPAERSASIITGEQPHGHDDAPVVEASVPLQPVGSPAPSPAPSPSPAP